jgi:hypothetical protein
VIIPPEFLVELALFDVGSWWKRSDGMPMQIVRKTGPHMYLMRLVYQFWAPRESYGADSYEDFSVQYLYENCKRIAEPEEELRARTEMIRIAGWKASK